MTARVELRILPDPVTLRAAALQAVLAAEAEALSGRGAFHLALSGGSTPRPLYEEMARSCADFPRWHVYFGDERCVPAEHRDSNFGMARAALLDHAPVPSEQVHRVRGELAPDRAAAAYERELRATLGEAPALDLVLLGIGEDGHTASLFPGSSALGERERLVAATWVQRLDSWRVTLTLPALALARALMFLVEGASKAAALRAVLEPRAGEPLLPARAVEDGARRAVWLVDEQAAAELPRRSR